MNAPAENAISKKAAIVFVAITAISQSQQWQAQAFIAGVAIVGVVAQAFLDWRRRSEQEPAQ